MNVLILNYEYPPIGGGAGVITQNISERLANSGNQVVVITTWFKGEEEITTTGNLTVIHLKAKRQYKHKSSVGEMLSWVSESKRFLKEYCSKNKFDICFANFAIPGGVVALYLKKMFGLKYTIISHGHDIPWRFPKQMRLFHMATYFKIRNICRESEANFMQTAEMMHNINAFIGSKYINKNLLIPNGIDTRLFKPDYTNRRNKFKIVFTGRLVEQKDPFTFLAAIKLFSAICSDIEAVVLGDGILLPKMKNYVNSNGLQDIILFKGWVPKTEMVQQYQSAHVTIVTSLFEGMSIAVMESLACGCYLISTPIDGIEEIITPGVNGGVVNFGSSKEIAVQLEKYYNEKHKKNYTVADSVTSKLANTYDWDNIVPQYEREFKKIAGV